MKHSSILYVGILLLFLGGGTDSVCAQSKALQPKADSVLLSERVEGNTLIRRYRIDRTQNADYRILYRINTATLSKQLGENSHELQALERIIRTILADSAHRNGRMQITGYASPDGPSEFNERLARARLRDFMGYANAQYDLSNRMNPRTASQVESWESCRSYMEASSIPERQAVLRLIDDPGLTPHEKQSRLEQMPEAWEYLKREVLPLLRRVEVVMEYGEQQIVEERQPIVARRPQPVVAQSKPSDPCGECPVVDERITGFIVEYPVDDHF